MNITYVHINISFLVDYKKEKNYPNEKYVRQGRLAKRKKEKERKLSWQYCFDFA